MSPSTMCWFAERARATALRTLIRSVADKAVSWLVSFATPAWRPSLSLSIPGNSCPPRDFLVEKIVEKIEPGPSRAKIDATAMKKPESP